MTTCNPSRHPKTTLTLHFVALFAAMLAPGAGAATSVALPDTGLFAPVAAQLRAREARLAKTTKPGAERLGLLLSTGGNDTAAREAKALKAGDPAALVARTRAAIAVQDFATAAPLVARLASSSDPDARGVHYQWLSIRDDAGSIDSLTHARLAPGAAAPTAPDFLAAARFAFDQFDYGRADSLYGLALAAAGTKDDETSARLRASARIGRVLVLQKRRKWDDALAESKLALAAFASPQALDVLAQTLIQLGRTDEAISAAEWGVRLDPYHLSSHYTLGNGYARKNYSQLFAAYPASFAAVADAKALTEADAALAAGRRAEARRAYESLVAADGRRVDARVRVASLDFEEGRFAESRDQCLAALATCPEYGRAHAVLAKALESQRFAIDVHRPDYEKRFEATPMPSVPGIERFVANWNALTPRHQKRVAISMAPWKNFIPVLVEGGATYYIKPLYQLLSEAPNLEPVRDTRIEYDSRLWDDVRGCGGYHTVTGLEDVERTIFDKYDTVVHELSHQVHGVMPADDVRAIQELYRKAKERDDVSKNGYLSRYAGGSVYEYFAEGANALVSPRRDRYDPREVVRERLLPMDPDLQHAVEKYMARTDVSASYPVAYASGGGDRVYRGQVDEAVAMYRKALAILPTEETAIVGLANALVLANRAAAGDSVATRAIAAHPTSGPAHLARAGAHWHATGDLAGARAALAAARGSVTAADRYQVDAALGTYAWTAGDATAAQAAFDSVLAYQSDNPDGLRGRAAALALAGHAEDAVAQYDAAVRVRTGVVGLRNDFARDLLWTGRGADASRQLAEARLIDEENPTAEALRGWAALEAGDLAGAREHVRQALAWGEWCDLARIVGGAVELRAGDRAAAERAWQPVRARMTSNAPPEYVFRPKISTWEETHTLPAVERRLLERFGAGVP
jgi:Tfp pilus assembly protein PilF